MIHFFLLEEIGLTRSWGEFCPTTLPETNIAPENRPSQMETSIPTIHFQVGTVSFRESSYKGAEQPCEMVCQNFLPTTGCQVPQHHLYPEQLVAGRSPQNL